MGRDRTHLLDTEVGVFFVGGDDDPTLTDTRDTPRHTRPGGPRSGRGLDSVLVRLGPEVGVGANDPRGGRRGYPSPDHGGVGVSRHGPREDVHLGSRGTPVSAPDPALGSPSGPTWGRGVGVGRTSGETSGEWEGVEGKETSVGVEGKERAERGAAGWSICLLVSGKNTAFVFGFEKQPKKETAEGSWTGGSEGGAGVRPSGGR